MSNNKFFNIARLIHGRDVHYVLDLDDLDSELNDGLDLNEKNMLKDLIKNGAHINICHFNDTGNVISLWMELGNQFSDYVFFSHLIELNISYNKAADFKFVRIHREVIVVFSMIGKNLTKIPDFSGVELTNLRELVLHRNNIETISGCGSQPRLNTLKLYNNQIKSLKGLEEFSNCPRLSQIELFNNQITDLCEFEPLSHLRSLRVITLNKNKITELNITHNVPKLRKIYLDKNQINKIVSIKNLPKLRYIALDHNNLTKIENISNLTKLRFLSVDDNPISSFSGMEELRELQSIEWIPYSSFKSDLEIKEWKLYFKNLGFKFRFNDYDELSIHKIRFPTITYHVNEHLSLKLKRDKINGLDPWVGIYVDDEPFNQCMSLLFTIDLNETQAFDNIESIDHLSENAEFDDEYYEYYEILAEDEFWGHCSNIQAWAEHDYDTRLIHRSLAFPLLRKLTEAGDSTAKRVFKEEIAKRYSSGHPNVQEYLRKEGYLELLSEDELNALKLEKTLKDELNL